VALFDSIRDQFFVVSVADFAPAKEWMVGRACEADAYCHKGELEFEALVALTSMAGLAFCSPGFAAVLAQAVGTPVACVFGGYEKSSFFFAGAKDAPVLGIDPINPCECFRHDHACRKEVNVPAAIERLQAFAAQSAGRSAVAA
jgi:ADP-heptose:LPS heptosyltransferase